MPDSVNSRTLYTYAARTFRCRGNIGFLDWFDIRNNVAENANVRYFPARRNFHSCETRAYNYS